MEKLFNIPNCSGSLKGIKTLIIETNLETDLPKTVLSNNEKTHPEIFSKFNKIATHNCLHTSFVL